MRKVLTASMIGNGLEWYDYALYGHMAFVISQLFFPGEDQTVQLIKTFGVFAVGFVFRPLGAVLFGWIGDTYGRRAALVIAILMMAIPTGCIGLLPTYEQIGVWAPVLLILIRILQGLSLGGEFSGSIVYIVEHAPKKYRGLAGSASIVSLILGFMLGSFVAMLTVRLLPEADFLAWGWRVPFLIGIVIGFVGLFIRRSCEESPAYLEAKEEGHLSARPVRDAIMGYPITMLQAFAVYITVTLPFYLVAIYFISFSQQELALSAEDALTVNVVAMFAMLIGTITGAYFSDRVGRRKILKITALAILLMIYPLFLWMDGADFMSILIAQSLLGFVVGAYIGPVPALLVELFPTSIRFTGMAISYNLSATIFGGTAPMICIWLIAQTGTPLSIAWYVIAGAVASLVAIYTYRVAEQPNVFCQV